MSLYIVFITMLRNEGLSGDLLHIYMYDMSIYFLFV